MAIYSSDPTVIPSLLFTKAELVYIVTQLTAELPANDNSTQLEMVELRHYCNLIKEQIGSLAKKGLLEAPQPEKTDSPAAPRSRLPSMEELRSSFPSLTEAEIREIIERNKAEQKEQTKKNEPPPPPQFIRKPPPEQNPPLSPKAQKDKENSEQFASLLGAV